MKRTQWNCKKQHLKLLSGVCVLVLSLLSWSTWANTASPKYRILLPVVNAQDNVLLSYRFEPYSQIINKESGRLSPDATVLSHNQNVEITNIQPVILRNTYGDLLTFTPGIAIVMGGNTYYTDARFVYQEGQTQSVYEQNFDAYRSLFLGSPLQGMPADDAPIPYHVNSDLFYAAMETPAGYRGTGYKASPTPPSADAQGTDDSQSGEGRPSGDNSGQSAAATPGGQASDLGNNIDVDVIGSGVELLDEVGVRPQPRPALAEHSEQALEGISLAVKGDLQAELISSNDRNQTGNFDLSRGARVKIIPDGRQETINGEVWREVEYINGFNRYRMMVPQGQLLTTSGATLTSSTPVRELEVPPNTTTTPLAGNAAEAAQEDVTQPAAETPAGTVTETATPAEGRAEPAQNDTAEATTGGTAQVPVSTCSNPEYLSYLTNQNPNCKLLPIDRLVRSSLKEGDAVLAMSNSDQKCYKLSVGQMTYSDDTLLNREIERVTKDRKDSYEAISRFLSNGHYGFVRQSEPTRNQYTVSCHDRTNVCSLGFGFEAAQRMAHVRTLTLPIGLESNVATDLKIQIFGPSADGFYMVRHMKGHSPSRVILIKNENNKLQEALNMIAKHTNDYANIQLSDEDRARANRNKMVLYAQLGDATGDKQTRTIEINPRRPFEQISKLNKDFTFYNISCQREDYNPLMTPSVNEGRSNGNSSGVE